MLLCVSTREAGPYPDYKHRTGRANMFTSDWKNAKMFALPSLRSYQPCLPDEPLRLHQLRRPTRCTHRRSKRNWYNTEGLNQIWTAKALWPSEFMVKYVCCIPTMNLRPKKIRKTHRSFQLPAFRASLPWPHLWLLAWTQKVCERRAHNGTSTHNPYNHKKEGWFRSPSASTPVSLNFSTTKTLYNCC